MTVRCPPAGDPFGTVGYVTWSAGPDNVARMHDAPQSAHDQPSPHAEELRVAMGWERLPTITPERHAEIERANAAAQAEARRIYGTPAA